MQDLMEKTITLALATGHKRFSTSLSKLVENYAELLASQGLLKTAMVYLKLLGSDEHSQELAILRDRIACSTEGRSKLTSLNFVFRYSVFHWFEVFFIHFFRSIYFFAMMWPHIVELNGLCILVGACACWKVLAISHLAPLIPFNTVTKLFFILLCLMFLIVIYYQISRYFIQLLASLPCNNLEPLSRTCTSKICIATLYYPLFFPYLCLTFRCCLHVNEVFLGLNLVYRFNSSFSMYAVNIHIWTCRTCLLFRLFVSRVKSLFFMLLSWNIGNYTWILYHSIY